jgi:hypothetical protein
VTRRAQKAHANAPSATHYKLHTKITLILSYSCFLPVVEPSHLQQRRDLSVPPDGLLEPPRGAVRGEEREHVLVGGGHISKAENWEEVVVCVITQKRRKRRKKNTTF